MPPTTLQGVRHVIVAFSLALPSTASAQSRPAPDTRPSIAELVAQLDSPVYVERQRATTDLLDRRDLSLEEAERLLTAPDHSPEQRLRLEAVALGVFARGPRAALGIRFPPESDGVVRIQEVLPGFPASDVLRAGDRILEADGLPIAKQATFRAVILSHTPGETMAMQLVRDGETREVDVPLGSFANLSGAATPRPGDLLAAWTIRQSRQTVHVEENPIVSVRAAPAEGDGFPEPGTKAWADVYASRDVPRGIVVGGQTRETIDLSLSQLTAMDASRGLTLEELQEAGPADIAVQLALLRNRRELIEETISQVSGLLERGNLDAAARAMMHRRLDIERQKLLVLEEQVRMLNEARQHKP